MFSVLLMDTSTHRKNLEQTAGDLFVLLRHTDFVQLLRDGCVSVSSVVNDDEQMLPAKVSGGEEIPDLIY